MAPQGLEFAPCPVVKRDGMPDDRCAFAFVEYTDPMRLKLHELSLWVKIGIAIGVAWGGWVVHGIDKLDDKITDAIKSRPSLTQSHKPGEMVVMQAREKGSEL